MIKNRAEVVSYVEKNITEITKVLRKKIISEFGLSKSQATDVITSVRKKAGKYKKLPKKWRLPMKITNPKWPIGVATTGRWSEPKKEKKERLDKESKQENEQTS